MKYAYDFAEAGCGISALDFSLMSPVDEYHYHNAHQASSIPITHSESDNFFKSTVRFHSFMLCIFQQMVKVNRYH